MIVNEMERKNLIRDRGYFGICYQNIWILGVRYQLESFRNYR